MTTTILSKERNVNYHIKFFHLLVIAFGFVVLTGTSGCFDGGTDDNALDTEQSKTGTGGSANTPSNHTDNINSFLHAPGKDTPYASWCTACHGDDLTGDIGPSCTTCHDPVWSETTPPSSGGRTSNAPSNHTDDINNFLHAAGKDTPYTSWCTACHGRDLTGDIGPSCTACHSQVWTETTPPSGGGSSSNPPSTHTDNVNGFLHAAGKDTPYSNWCTACHGATLEGDLNLGAPSCTTCHDQVWTESPPTGGGSTSNPPTNHTDDVSGFLHATDKQTPYSSFCTACHGAALEGDINSGAPSCTTCHGQIWTEMPPTGGGSTSNPPSNHTDNISGFLHAAGKDTPYTNFCTVCHGPALEGDVDSGTPSCTTCHGQLWTETPPTGGGSTSNPPSNHTDDVNGFLHAPGRATPYSNWCTACHGDALEGNVDLGAPSCTACHGQYWTETAPPSGGGSNPPSNHTDDVGGFLHAPGRITPYTNWCTACHGADLTGDLGPSCTACHDQYWTETAPPSGGGSNPPSNHTNNVNGFLHAAGKLTPYSNWCTACHGADLTGDLGPSCIACHGQVWTETAPPSGGGSNPPSNHTDIQSGFLHGPGKTTPYSSWCTACHGDALAGNLDLGAPSCTACHGQVWTETAPPGGGGSGNNPPSNHTDNVSGFVHAAGKTTPYSSWCTACHGDALEGDLNTGTPSCTACHGQVWTEAPPSGGGSSSNAPSNHTDNVSGFLHAPGRSTPYSSWCTICHGDALQGDLNLGAPSCTACHGQLWTETTPPSGGGGSSNLPTNHTNNINGFLHASGNQTPFSSWCTACHGAALEGDFDLGAPSCTACHAPAWTEAPPSGGGSSSNPPSNHSDSQSGFLHAPGKQTPYSSWCTACHGNALQGDLDLGAPSCTACHGQVWSESTPPGGGGSDNPPSSHTNSISGFLHAPGNDTPYSSWCTVCHGSSLQGDLDIGAPPCSACHTVLWSETGGGPTGNPPANHTDNVSGFDHAPGKDTPYSSWCWGCHGSNLQGDSSIGAPPCTVCHTVQWSETPSDARRLPSNHTDSERGFLHAPGKNDPFGNLCTVCHGADLRGDSTLGTPSCYQCHGQEWSGGSGGGGGGGGDGGGGGMD